MKEKIKEKYSDNLIIFSIIYCLTSIFILLISDFWPLRIISIFFFFFFLGYPISLFFKNLNIFERISLSLGISHLILLLSYYILYMSAYSLNVTPTFDFQVLLIGIYFVSSSLILLFYFKRKNYPNSYISLSNIKDFFLKYKFLLFILVLGTFLRFAFLNCPDFSTDETYFVATSYPLVDPFQITGLPPPPLTFLSGHHPPLTFVGTNFIMNILNPIDWLAMLDWMGKFYFAFIGSISIFSIFSLLNKIYGKYAGYVGALFYSLNTYAIVVSRVGYQEILLILFLIITLDFMYRENWKLTGFFLGISLLTKFTAVIIIPTIILYLIIKNFKFDKKQIKKLLINFSQVAVFAMVLYLPILISNIAIHYHYGYADTFLSRIFGLKDPLSEAIGEAELPVGLMPAGLFAYSSVLNLQIVNVIGIILIPYIIFCVILSFLDKGKILLFNLINFIFLILLYLIFTSRWFQIISLSPIIIPIIIISCRIVNLDKVFHKLNKFFNISYPIFSARFKPIIKKIERRTTKFRFPTVFRYKNLKKNYRKHNVKYQHFVICSILMFFFSFSFIYSWNTIAYPHFFFSNDIDDLRESFRTNTEYSTIGYLWIMRNGYDEVMEIIRNFRYFFIYVDDNHPKFSYIYYFYQRGITSLVSDWDNRTNSLFIFYKQPNYMWESFTYSNKGDANEHYIREHGTCIWESLNFEIYII